jgi:hypothetical protein
MKKSKVTQKEFNLWVTNILALYSKFLGIPIEEIGDKLIEFEKQLDNQIKQHDEKSLQLGQDDQTSPQFV